MIFKANHLVLKRNLAINLLFTKLCYFWVTVRIPTSNDECSVANRIGSLPEEGRGMDARGPEAQAHEGYNTLPLPGSTTDLISVEKII